MNASQILFSYYSTVYAYLLKKHLTKCNARKTESLHPFYSLDINAGDKSPHTPGLGLGELDDKQLMTLIEKIQTIGKCKL